MTLGFKVKGIDGFKSNLLLWIIILQTVRLAVTKMSGIEAAWAGFTFGGRIL
jgi:hypothetical protein